jgi:Lrp/AsnC family transcriptional regulator, regulator for asnA, asnC and gidA
MGQLKLSEEDIEIIRFLHKDARAPISRIAEELGLPESTTRHKLNRLVENGVINFEAVSDPTKLGYSTWVVLMLSVDLKKVRTLAEKIATLPEVYFVAITNGTHEIQVSAVFPSNEELLIFLTNKLSKFDGIKSVHSYNLLSIVKRRMAILPPDRK